MLGQLPLDMSPDDASLNEKLAQMASKVYRDVVIPIDHLKEDDPVAYERRQLNLDGTWKEQRYNNRVTANPGFHFLEYASKNFKNPLELITATSPSGGSPTVASVTQVQSMAQIDQLDH